jgi:hypothetical protein
MTHQGDVMTRTRRWTILLLLPFLALISACDPELPEPEPPTPGSLLQRLSAIPGLTVTAITPPDGYSQAFSIDITQPLDHDNPAGSMFQQRFYLSHRRESGPMVFYTTGYGVSRNGETELGAMVNGNQIMLVHRFFPGARPSPLDWTRCTLRQAAADQHRIRTLLGQVYTGRWLATGVSKGGMTALFYKRFYPDDVDATVAYVAPIMNTPDDPRFIPFLQQVGDAACRAKITAFQREVLKRRSAMLNLLLGQASDKGYTFNRIGLEAALEYMVLEYPFAFWQYGSESNCFGIPDMGSSDTVLFDHLSSVSPASFYTDEDITHYEPLFYQAYTEFGYCPFMTDHLEDLLLTLTAPSYRAFAPKTPMTFNPAIMNDIAPWLRSQGQRIIYIYGGIDPWTTAALEPDPGLDCVFVVQAGANHGVQIAELDRRAEVISALNRWMGLSLTQSGQKSLIRQANPVIRRF